MVLLGKNRCERRNIDAADLIGPGSATLVFWLLDAKKICFIGSLWLRIVRPNGRSPGLSLPTQDIMLEAYADQTTNQTGRASIRLPNFTAHPIKVKTQLDLNRSWLLGIFTRGQQAPPTPPNPFPLSRSFLQVHMSSKAGTFKVVKVHRGRIQVPIVKSHFQRVKDQFSFASGRRSPPD